jgi:antitoxin component YwqK of YwqJK toxin-antitoxin module
LAEEWRYKDVGNANVWQWDEEGKLTDEFHHRNGDIDGLWTKYWPDGSPRRQAEWRAGKLDGEFTEWYENGSVSARGRYADNRKIGEWRFWDDAGTESLRVY